MGTYREHDTYTREGWVQGDSYYTGSAPTENAHEFDDLETLFIPYRFVGTVTYAVEYATHTDGVEAANWVEIDGAFYDWDGNEIRKAEVEDIPYLLLPDACDIANEDWANE